MRKSSNSVGVQIGWCGTRSAKQQYAQHVEYTLRPDHTGTSTVVTVVATVEPDTLIPDFFIKRAGKTVIDAANEGLRNRVLRGEASDQPE